MTTSGRDALPREHGFERLRVEGALPPALRGTLYRCGPGEPGRFDHAYRHWFDGDGVVTAVRFDGGIAHGAARFVDTPGRQAESRAGAILYPTFATLPPGPAQPMPRPKPAANTSVHVVDDRLLAFYEAGAPVELDRELRTRGPIDFGVASIRDGFSAHPHRARGALYNFGLHFGETTRLTLYELRDGTARELGRIPLPGPTMVHDFAVTDRHLVFFISPLRVDVVPFLKGLVSYADSLRWRPELGTEVIVVPIDEPGRVTRFTTDAFFQWHFAGAREDATGTITIDLVRHAGFARDPASCGALVRATVDPVARTVRSEPRADVPLEFPVAAGDDVYAVAHDRLVHIDARGRTTLVGLGAGTHPSEPVLAEPWLLTLVYDATAHASHVAVLDTRHLADGPVARAWFDHHVPSTLHGTWCD
jgi:all-trans-8'-apo-beta-carotenal 15,15'-oxygenase